MKKLIRWIKSLFTGINENSNSADADGVNSNELPKNDPIVIELETYTGSDPELFAFNAIFRANLFKTAKNFYNKGKEDGIVGFKNIDAVSNKAEFWASDLVSGMRSSIEGVVTGLASDMEKDFRMFREAENEHKEKKEYVNWLKKEYHHDSRSFSLILGLFYLFISLLLILADIPLALELIYKGFDLARVQNENTKIIYLFTRFALVIRDNWEIFILSVGIALCTVYIKIYYDEFVGKPLDRKVFYYKKLKADFHLNEEEIEKIKKEETERKWVKRGVLFFSLFTIIILGCFRYLTLQDSATNPSKPYISNLYEGPKGIITGVAFTAITLLFPLIGGICASLGINAVLNFLEMKKSRKDERKEYHLQENAKMKYNTICNKYYNWERFFFRLIPEIEKQSWRQKIFMNEGKLANSLPVVEDVSRSETQSRFEKEIKAYYCTCYQEGFNKGLLSPEQTIDGADLFSKAETLRNKLISKRMSNAIVSRGRLN